MGSALAAFLVVPFGANEVPREPSPGEPVPTIEELLRDEEPRAVDRRPSRASVDQRDAWLFAFAGGAFAILDEETRGEVGFEVRAPTWKFLRPIFGGSVIGDGSLYGYAGLRYDWRISERWTVGPSVSAAAYFPGDEYDLGNTLQFRTSIEASYRIADHSRLGIDFYHISNAGLADTNPGAESLSVTYTFSPGIGD